MKIIGITGTIGAGKGEVVNYLKEKQGFKHFSVRDYIVREIEKRGLEINRDHMREVANDLREKHGSSFIIEELYREALEKGENCVIESIRTAGEVEFLKSQKDFEFWAVDASQQLRYERVVLRKSVTDQISFEKFVADEDHEMRSTDPAHQNLSACIALSDYLLQNNSSLTDLHTQIDKILN